MKNRDIIFAAIVFITANEFYSSSSAFSADLELYKETCAKIGFKAGTEGYGNCVLQLHSRAKKASDRDRAADATRASEQARQEQARQEQARQEQIRRQNALNQQRVEAEQQRVIRLQQKQLELQRRQAESAERAQKYQALQNLGRALSGMGRQPSNQPTFSTPSKRTNCYSTNRGDGVFTQCK